MLVLSRRVGQTIDIGDNIRITVIHAENGRARIGIDAPIGIPIWRTELLPRIELPPTDEVNDGTVG